MTGSSQEPSIETPLEIPQEILDKIKNACIAGMVSIAITIVTTIISMSGMDIFGLNAWAFVDVFIMIILVYGVYRKSRVCAILMLLLFAANKLVMWAEHGMANGLVLSLVFFWFYTQGVIGTFQYHSTVKENNPSTTPSINDENEKTDALIELATKPLKIQANLVSDNYGVIPDIAKDNWCIGYIGGFTDSALQKAKIPMNGEAFAIMTIVYSTIFGNEDGPAYFRKFMDLQKSEDGELYQGMISGGNEFMDWIEDNEKIPTGWADHVISIRES